MYITSKAQKIAQHLVIFVHIGRYIDLKQEKSAQMKI